MEVNCRLRNTTCTMNQKLSQMNSFFETRHEPADLQRAIAEQQLISIRNPESGDPLFCIHPSGGDIGIYRKLATRLGTSRAIWGIQSRLICGAENEYGSLNEMACAYSRIITDQHPQGSVRLLGFSLGGFLASLMAQELQRAGRHVSFLGLIDSNPGWTGESDASRQELCLRLTQVFTKFQSIGVMKQKPLETVQRDVATLVDACLSDQPASSDEIMARTTAMGYVPDRGSESGVLMRFTNTFIAHCRLLKGFEPPQVNCPLHLWWPSDAGEENSAGSRIWAQHSNDSVTESVIQGSHYSIMRGVAVRTLGAEVKHAIELSDDSKSEQIHAAAPPRKAK